MKAKINYPEKIRIGTRRSILAVAQAEEVKIRLMAAFPELDRDNIQLVRMDTTGDLIQDRHLAEIGGKGLFTKEIEDSLFAGDIDFAVHSMKDMTDTLPDGLVIDCILEREDPRDAFISNKVNTLLELPKGAVVGTSSIRRQSQLLKIRPDLKVVQFRGNIFTRMEKLERGDVDATFLATAGLRRVGEAKKITSIIESDIMLPAVAQGAIGVEHLADNEVIGEMLSAINHYESNVRVTAERAFLKALGGSCSTPIAGLAEIEGDDKLRFRGLVASPDGKAIYSVGRSGAFSDATTMGKDAGAEVLKNASELLGDC